MEGLKGTIEALSLSFSQRMAQFEGELKKTSTPQQPSLSTLSVEFNVFREFVMATLKNLEQQVTVLMMECDNVETRSRRAMLLLHGVPEVRDEVPVKSLLKVASQHLAGANLCEAHVVRASRLGKARPDKPRPLLVKLQSEALRDNLWSLKTGLKGSGITMSEFLTKPRHKVFLAARERLGVTKCWTSAGRIVAIAQDGKRHRIVTLADIDRLTAQDAGTASTTATSTAMRGDSQSSAPKGTSTRAASARRKNQD